MNKHKFFSNDIPYYLNQSIDFRKKKFTDSLFPPNMNSILGLDTFGNHTDKKYGKNRMKELLRGLKISENPLFLYDKVYWKRISDLTNNNYSIFEKEIDCTKFKQGDIGNCYFISSVATLSNYSQLIIQLFRQDNINQEGYYEICLFINGHWQIIIIDDYLPFYKDNENFVFSKPADNCYGLFLCLLEKAYAKIKGGYANIISGNPFDIYELLTGFNAEPLYNDIYFSDLRENILKNNIINLCFENHAYSLLNTNEYKFNFKTYKLLQIRDPYGISDINYNLPFNIEF